MKVVLLPADGDHASAAIGILDQAAQEIRCNRQSTENQPGAGAFHGITERL